MKKETVMRSFMMFIVIALTTLFFLGCTTEEEKAKSERNLLIISMLKQESPVGKIKIHRVIDKNPTYRAGKLIVLAIDKGYLTAGDPIRGTKNGRYRINAGSAPAIVKKHTIWASVLDNVEFELVGDPVVTTLGSHTSIFIEYNYKGKLNEFGKFLKEGGAEIDSEGSSVFTMERIGNGKWHKS